MEQEVRSVVRDGAGWSDIEEVGGGVEGFNPKGRRHMRLEKESAKDAFVERMARSALPFCGEVCGQERRRVTPRS